VRQKHWRYLRGLSFEGVEAVVYQEYLESLEYHLARLRDIDRQIGELAKTAEYQQSVSRLRCLRGVDTQTAMVLLTEVIDFQRFANPRYLMSYLGLVPSQHSSGHSSRLGSITKTGNSRCRRILIESSWHYRHKPSVNRRLKEAWSGQPPALTAIAWKAQKRLHDKFWHIALGKDKQTAVVAVARELTGFVWAIMQNI
jgi:transposase